MKACRYTDQFSVAAVWWLLVQRRLTTGFNGKVPKSWRKMVLTFSAISHVLEN
jgi:hypothetical protein